LDSLALSTGTESQRRTTGGDAAVPAETAEADEKEQRACQRFSGATVALGSRSAAGNGLAWQFIKNRL